MEPSLQPQDRRALPISQWLVLVCEGAHTPRTPIRGYRADLEIEAKKKRNL